MTTQTISAHFDGHNICLDEPVAIEPNTKMSVTLVQEDAADEDDNFREDWQKLSTYAFAKLYEREERDYGLELIKKPNPLRRK